MVSRYTAFVIQNVENDVRCEPFKRGEKWGWKINMYNDGSLHSALLSSEAELNSSAEAEKEAGYVIKKIREVDLSK